MYNSYSYTSSCVYHLKAVRPLAQAEYKDAEFTPLSLFNFFINRCRENLHIVLAMSPIGDAFRNRLRQFPSLINCCTIDWFQVSIEANNLHMCCILLSHRLGQMMLWSW